MAMPCSNWPNHGSPRTNATRRVGTASFHEKMYGATHDREVENGRPERRPRSREDEELERDAPAHGGGEAQGRGGRRFIERSGEGIECRGGGQSAHGGVDARTFPTRRG